MFILRVDLFVAEVFSKKFDNVPVCFLRVWVTLMGYAINQWQVPACTRILLSILTLSLLITSPTGGNCLLNTCKRFAFSRAAVMFARTTCTLQVTYQLNYFLLEKKKKYIIAFTLYHFSSSPPPATAIFSGASSKTSLFIVISYYVPENRMS